MDLCPACRRARARRAYANVDAAEMYERALEAGEGSPVSLTSNRVELLGMLGELRRARGVLDGSVEAYGKAAGLQCRTVSQGRSILAKRARVQQAGVPHGMP